MKKQIATLALAVIAIGGGAYGVSSVIKESTSGSIVKTEPVVTALPSEDIISVPTTTVPVEKEEETTTVTGTRVGITETASLYDSYKNDALGFVVSISDYKVSSVTNGTSFECKASLKNISNLEKKLTISSIRLIDEDTKMQYACTNAYIGNTSLPNKNEYALASGKSDNLSFKGAVGITGVSEPKCAIYLVIKDSISGDQLNLYLKLHSSVYDAQSKKIEMTEDSLALEDYGIVISHSESKSIKLDTDLLIAEKFNIENKTDNPITLYGYMSSLTYDGNSIDLPTTQDSEVVFPNSTQKMMESMVVLNGINTSGAQLNQENEADFTFSSMVIPESIEKSTTYTISFSIYLPDYTEVLEVSYKVTI